jgi:SAM-dependent methyltransferase
MVANNVPSDEHPERTNTAVGMPAPPSSRCLQRDLFIVSVLALFCELLIIRWLATEVRVFAYFKNLPLMSAFLGLGLGFLWSDRKRDCFGWSAFGLLYLSAILICAFGLGLTYLTFVDPRQFMLFGLQALNAGQQASSAWTTVRSLAIMLALFALTTSIFVGLGQRMGKTFARLKPLEAYSINIAGSLAGSALFSLLSWLRTDPGIWLCAAGVLYLSVQRKAAHFLLIGLGLTYSFLLAGYLSDRNFGPDHSTVWSPYYRIDVLPYRQPSGPFQGAKLGYNIYINYDSFQSILDCSSASISRFPPEVQRTMLNTFSIPFTVLPKHPSRVLVLGSGTGNDVAAALRCGAQQIDAVEIDPAIVEIGRRLHPEKPYDSDKVTLHVMDARTFLKNSKNTYDIVVFAALDSHAAFSSLSSLRLDNYVFTQEAMKEAARLLSPDGYISLKFVVIDDWLWNKQAKTLAGATGMQPLGYCVRMEEVDGLLLAGPGLAGKTQADLKLDWPTRTAITDASTAETADDWPFLFLPKKEIPTLYILPILSVLLLGFLPVASQLRQGASDPINWQMFGLGMGFMLLEVRAMADLSLLFGSTWIINSVIISGVMVVVLIANYFAARISVRRISWAGGGLLLSLALTTAIKPDDLSSLGSALGGLAGTVMYLFPLIFSSTIFALLFKDSSKPTSAFAFNLVGGLIGVCLEYLSMWLGVRALGWIAVAIYALTLSIGKLSSDKQASQGKTCC